MAYRVELDDGMMWEGDVLVRLRVYLREARHVDFVGLQGVDNFRLLLRHRTGVPIKEL